MVMTRHQRAAIAAAEEWLARQPPTAQAGLASQIRNAVKWAAAQAGGFTGQRLAKELLKITGVIAGVRYQVRHF
jgi:hypothetical protein